MKLCYNIKNFKKKTFFLWWKLGLCELPLCLTAGSPSTDARAVSGFSVAQVTCSGIQVATLLIGAGTILWVRLICTDTGGQLELPWGKAYCAGMSLLCPQLSLPPNTAVCLDYRTPQIPEEPVGWTTNCHQGALLGCDLGLDYRDRDYTPSHFKKRFCLLTALQVGPSFTDFKGIQPS